ncbi:hypothetical protein AAG570_006340 [Ranatra chinensis]|uniref:DNA-directed RNA polymerase III subunit RPC3 n=1 Tax=Ranatra chinensis TaxID=642074 RepID=A0ABD0YUC6_9HEMI
MSLKYERLCSLLISEHFGSTVQKIHSELQWGPRTLSLLISATGLPAGIVKKGLCVMIQYGFVTFSPGKVPSVAEYSLQHDQVILILRYPRYLTLIKDTYGEPSRLLLCEVMKHGCLTASKAIQLVWNQIKEGQNKGTSLEDLRSAFHDLIINQYLMCCPTVSETCTDKVPVLTVEETDLYNPPELPLKELKRFVEDESATDPGDGKVYWRPNFDRFHQDLRDKVMINAVKRRFDDHAGTLMEVLLNLMYLRTAPWVTRSNPVPVQEIKESVERKLKNTYLAQYLDQYIKVIEEDSSNFIRKHGDGNFSSVHVNIVTAVQYLTVASIENLVEYRFGSKAARIFRLVCMKKYIDQEQLQKLAMIPDKEAKQLTYKLIHENFLHLKEVRKTGGAGPAKNFYLFHIDFHQVVHMVLEICYKAVYNTLTRAAHERNENIRLIEKQEKLNSIAECMREQGTDDQQIKELVDEWMSPPEKAQLESIETMIENLRLAELHVDDTIFLMQLYNYYETACVKEAREAKASEKAKSRN